MLLDDPATALAHGYNGEVFDIRPDEQAQVLAMRADTLAEFAARNYWSACGMFGWMQDAAVRKGLDQRRRPGFC